MSNFKVTLWLSRFFKVILFILVFTEGSAFAMLVTKKDLSDVKVSLELLRTTVPTVTTAGQVEISKFNVLMANRIDDAIKLLAKLNQRYYRIDTDEIAELFTILDSIQVNRMLQNSNLTPQDSSGFAVKYAPINSLLDFIVLNELSLSFSQNFNPGISFEDFIYSRMKNYISRTRIYLLDHVAYSIQVLAKDVQFNLTSSLSSTDSSELNSFISTQEIFRLARNYGSIVYFLDGILREYGNTGDPTALSQATRKVAELSMNWKIGTPQEIILSRFAKLLLKIDLNPEAQLKEKALLRNFAKVFETFNAFQSDSDEFIQNRLLKQISQLKDDHTNFRIDKIRVGFQRSDNYHESTFYSKLQAQWNSIRNMNQSELSQIGANQTLAATELGESPLSNYEDYLITECKRSLARLLLKSRRIQNNFFLNGLEKLGYSLELQAENIVLDFPALSGVNVGATREIPKSEPVPASPLKFPTKDIKSDVPAIEEVLDNVANLLEIERLEKEGEEKSASEDFESSYSNLLLELIDVFTGDEDVWAGSTEKAIILNSAQKLSGQNRESIENLLSVLSHLKSQRNPSQFDEFTARLRSLVDAD